MTAQIAAYGLGFPSTVDLRALRIPNDVIGVSSANQAIWVRCIEGGNVSKVGLNVVTASGNISVAAYRNTGSGRDAAPGTLLASSGSVACPAAGYSELVLGSTVSMAPGDWLAISADNATAKFSACVQGTPQAHSLGKGVMYIANTSHPLPSAASGLVAAIGYSVLLIGVP